MGIFTRTGRGTMAAEADRRLIRPRGKLDAAARHTVARRQPSAAGPPGPAPAARPQQQQVGVVGRYAVVMLAAAATVGIASYLHRDGRIPLASPPSPGSPSAGSRSPRPSSGPCSRRAPSSSPWPRRRARAVALGAVGFGVLGVLGGLGFALTSSPHIAADLAWVPQATAEPGAHRCNPTTIPSARLDHGAGSPPSGWRPSPTACSPSPSPCSPSSCVPPNLATTTSVAAVLHALAQQLRQFGFYALAFLIAGRLWIEHHQLLDPLETHGRRLPRVNLWFLLTVSLLPYWVSVMATYPNNSVAAGLFVLWLGVTQLAFVVLCLLVRGELAPGPSAEELIMPKVIRTGMAAVMLGVLGGLLVAQVPVSDVLFLVWLLLVVVGGRSAVGLWTARHRRRTTGG